jgi:hypothetical protein
VTRTLEDVIRYWEQGAPERGLVTPLRDWAVVYSSKEYRCEAAKLSNIKYMYNEWAIQYRKDDAQFDCNYAGLRGQYTKLKDSILKA